VTAGVAASSCDWGDFDNDGWMDLYVTDSGGFTKLYRNQGDGTFVDEALDRGRAPPLRRHVAMWGDYDNDQDLDLFVTGLAQAGLLGTNHLFESVGGRFSARRRCRCRSPARSATWADFDDDRDLDVYSRCGNSTPNQLLRQQHGEPQRRVDRAARTRVRTATASGATVRVLANGIMQYRRGVGRVGLRVAELDPGGIRVGPRGRRTASWSTGRRASGRS
jgi:hypothetical protein